MEYSGKNVSVVGLARSGMACAERLAAEGAKVSVYDMCSFNDKADEIIGLMNKGVTVYCRSNDIDMANTDLIVTSPGIPPAAPFFAEADRLGIEVISEIELAYRLSPCPILAVTGTNGKTTTTVMAGKILKEAGLDYFIGGNVAGYKPSAACRGREGLTLTECVGKAEKGSVIVCEVSTFQLERCTTFAPEAGALLNVGTDHLDRHGTRENYAALKAKLFAFQTEDDIAVLNADDPFVSSLADKVKSSVFMFSLQGPVERGCWLENGKIMFRDGGEAREALDASILKVPGKHNAANAMAAFLLTRKYAEKGAEKALSGFRGVSHRLETVDEINGVTYVNNSMCTNVAAAVSSVNALETGQVLICGGKDKGSDFAPFARAVKEKCRFAVVIGRDKGKILEAFGKEGYKNCCGAETLKEAVLLASEKALKGDSVVLTPGCASFDMFSSFEDRGNRFTEIVKEMSGKHV